MTTLLISVTAYGVRKLSFTGLTAADRPVLDAVERLQRPAAPRALADATDPAQLKEFERYNEDLSTMRGAIDEGSRAAGIVARTDAGDRAYGGLAPTRATGASPTS